MNVLFIYIYIENEIDVLKDINAGQREGFRPVGVLIHLSHYCEKVSVTAGYQEGTDQVPLKVREAMSWHWHCCRRYQWVAANIAALTVKAFLNPGHHLSGQRQLTEPAEHQPVNLLLGSQVDQGGPGRAQPRRTPEPKELNRPQKQQSRPQLQQNRTLKVYVA
jgi:hypothetical protein